MGTQKSFKQFVTRAVDIGGNLENYPGPESFERAQQDNQFGILSHIS